MIRTQAEWEAAATEEIARAQVDRFDGPGRPSSIATALWPLVAPLAAAVEQAEQTMAIVQKLAAADPLVPSEVAPGEPYCTLCGADIITAPPPKQHEEGCPWRRAVALTREDSNG